MTNKQGFREDKTQESNLVHNRKNYRRIHFYSDNSFRGL